MARRFAVLVLLLCLFGMLVVLLRRGRVPGVASGPAWRLIGTTAVGLLLLTFTPTKWAVQFGAFAGLAGALGAVTAFAFARIGLHSRRNLALYVTALLFVLAWATSGINGWFYVGNYGVPWFDIQPVIASHPVTSMFLALSIVDRAAGRLAALPDGLRRAHRGQGQPAQPGAGLHPAAGGRDDHGRRRGRLAGQGRRASATRSTPPPRPTSPRSASGLSPTSCAMADDVLAEPDPNAGLLQPVPGQTFGPGRPARRQQPGRLQTRRRRRRPEVRTRWSTKPGVVNSDASPNKPNAAMSDSAGTAGGKGPVGVNGSHVALPFGLDPARTPVMGSYGENSLAATATSAWYQLPPRTADRPLVVVVGRRRHLVLQRGRHLHLRAVAETAVGRRPPRRHHPAARRRCSRSTSGREPAWRNLRFPLTWAPPEANVARIVAYDPNLSSDQWFAFTPPRVPVLQTLQQLIGSQTPVLMDIATAANFPCQRPFSEHLGVAELPQYRILPDHKQTAASSNGWQAGEAGGPFLFTPGAAAHLDDLDVPAWRLVSRLGIRRAVLPVGAG